ncbi:hypothetical protein L198_00467 [Cryptococcus wingfieldii CBS 7118]|uniref:N-acetyltransferase domain-containing protein n=1 Tax=Cryptococcus wingfieldii CBS 7118 TaxID=1295528 RepID=A0A1E3K6C8_9TREE|nr:hypothetical protein L198_00467 [Cryptococcus wingfieldii CBS 7118]ODO08734.1 hypothetical protein L198_00467 [Cryptococcus wingfieldii CBS 7118]
MTFQAHTSPPPIQGIATNIPQTTTASGPSSSSLQSSAPPPVPPRPGVERPSNAFFDLGESEGEAFADFQSLSLSAKQAMEKYASSPKKGKGKAAEQPLTRMVDSKGGELWYRTFRSEEEDLEGIIKLVETELSEPYNVYTYRYFLYDWPDLTWVVFPTSSPSAGEQPIATVISKLDSHRCKYRGYIAMLSVHPSYRRRGIARKLVDITIEEMRQKGAHEVMLETEFDNDGSLALYDGMGFLREKRLWRFYSNEKDAFRLILPLPNESDDEEEPGLRRIVEDDEDDPSSAYFT